jgi:hypothetical protein
MERQERRRRRVKRGRTHEGDRNGKPEKGEEDKGIKIYVRNKGMGH